MTITSDRAFDPDREQIAKFVQGIFKHCGSNGNISSRAFYEGENRPFRIRNLPLVPELLLDGAADDARYAASSPQAVVYCPPLGGKR